MEHIPADGGVIIVANHISHADPLVVAHFVYDAGRWPQFLGKASLFRVPVVGWLLHQVRQIPVRARHASTRSRSLDAAGRRRSRTGGAVVIYPEGTTTTRARPVADARQDRRGPAGAGHRRAGGPGRRCGGRSGSSTRGPTSSACARARR